MCVRVYLLGIAIGTYNQAPTLQQEADLVFRWDKADVQTIMSHEPAATVPTTATALVHSDDATTDSIAEEMARTVPEAQFPDLILAVRAGSIPPEWDGLLLKAGVRLLKQNPLPDQTRRDLRKAFKAAVRKRAET